MAITPAKVQFEPGAQIDYIGALEYYETEANSPELADRFDAAIQKAASAISVAPRLWRITEGPDVRRYVIQRFPYVVYYRYELAAQLVIVYAIVHTSRQPDYWRGRIPS